MTYAEAIQFLYGLQMFGAHFGLENTFKLAALASNPQEKLRFIHVAGTNGKGSTCAMLRKHLSRSRIARGAVHITAPCFLSRTHSSQPPVGFQTVNSSGSSKKFSHCSNNFPPTIT